MILTGLSFSRKGGAKVKIQNLKIKLIAFALLGLLILLAYLTGFGCLWQRLFSVPCPGCGMTRAWLAVLRLDFSAALSFHPMFWSVPLLFIYILWDGEPFRNALLNILPICLIGVGFLAVWLVRLFG